MSRRTRSVVAARVAVAAALAAVAAPGAAEPAGDPGAAERPTDVFQSERFRIHRPNWVLFGAPLPHLDTTPLLNQVKFRLSVEYVVVGHVGTPAGPAAAPGPALLVAYTQTSFWNLYEESQPLYDTHYQPEAYLAVPLGHGEAELAAGVRHHSNGRDVRSRSFQQTFVRFTRPLGSAAGFAALEAWFPWNKPDNPDIADYTGYGQAEIYWRGHASAAVLRDPSLSLRLPFGGRTLVPAVEVTAAIGVGDPAGHGLFSPRLALQYSEGYAQNLTDYRDRTSSWRLGVVFAE